VFLFLRLGWETTNLNPSFCEFEPTKPEETPKKVEKIAFHVEN